MKNIVKLPLLALGFLVPTTFAGASTLDDSTVTLTLVNNTGSALQYESFSGGAGTVLDSVSQNGNKTKLKITLENGQGIVATVKFKTLTVYFTDPRAYYMGLPTLQLINGAAYSIKPYKFRLNTADPHGLAVSRLKGSITALKSV